MTLIDQIWLTQLEKLTQTGSFTSPRGRVTQELLNQTITINMKMPVLGVKSRNLSYRFMFAEARWILDGDEQADTIVPYNLRLAEFSDDGKIFAGAYGPKIKAQLPYIVDTLLRDPDSRQAGLTIWKPSPPFSKDIPCTVAMWFVIRENTLTTHVFMRSSDVWLGLPYDLFNFSMVSYLVTAKLYGHGLVIAPGLLHLTMVSSHLYQQDFSKAINILTEHDYMLNCYTFQPLNKILWQSETKLFEFLRLMQDKNRLAILQTLSFIPGEGDE